MRRFLVPTVSIVVSLAVAVAVAIIGMGFATPKVTALTPSTMTSTVLSPIDPASPLGSRKDANGSTLGSPVLGSRAITTPGSVTGHTLPADVSAALDALAAAADPAAVDPTTPDPSSTDPTSTNAADYGVTPFDQPGGDPCAPSDGSAPAADCPAGLSSTILAQIHLPDLVVRAGQNSREGCNPLVEETSTHLQFGVATNAPATTVITWGQGAVADHSLTVSTSAADNTAWQNTLATATSIGPWIWLHTCADLTGLTPYLPVGVHFVTTDFQGRTATRDVTMYPLDRRGRPATVITPVGTSTVFVSAPHTPTDEIRIRAFTVPAGQSPTCDTSQDVTGSLDQIRNLTETDVSAATLAAGDYRPEYTKRTSTAFAVPSSSQIMVCVRWYTPGRESWDQDRPNYQRSQVLVTPEIVAPVVTLDGVALNQRIAARGVVIETSTDDGATCGAWTSPDAPTDSVNIPANGQGLCDFGSLFGHVSHDGSLVVTTRVQTTHGTAVNANSWPVALATCEGACPARSFSFDVHLSTFIRPTQLCSGDCPMNSGQEVGVARVTATWPAQVGAGVDGWTFGVSAEGTYNEPRPAFAQLDTAQVVQLDPVDVAARTQAASVTIRTDRPATFVAHIDGACFRPGAVHDVRQTTATTNTLVHFPALCVGTGYSLTVTLTDADGHVSVYDYRRSDHFWINAAFSTATTPHTIVSRLSITKPGAGLVYLYDLRLMIGYTRTRVAPIDGYRCYVSAITPVDVSTAVDVGESFPVEVYAAYVPGDAIEPGYLRVDGAARCGPTAVPQTFMHFTTNVTLAQVASGATVTITDPATGYVATLHVHE